MAPRARRAADALLRRRLVHRPRGGAGLRGARLRGLHAAGVTPAVSPRRCRLGRARRAGADRRRRPSSCRPADDAWRGLARAGRRAAGPSGARPCLFPRHRPPRRRASRRRSWRRCASSRSAGPRRISTSWRRRSATTVGVVAWEDVARGEAADPRRRIPSCRARHQRSLRSARAHADAARRDAGEGPADIRRSRLYVLSRGPVVEPSATRGERRRARRRRRRRARARPLRRARPPRPRLRRHVYLVSALGHRPGGMAAVPRADHGDRLLPGGPLRAARAARRLGPDPRRARPRGADHPRVRDSGRTTTSRRPGSSRPPS